MANLFIGLTDYDWYDFLRTRRYDEVNFWRPGGTAFRALRPGELFLFKLKSPHYAIVGGGFFVKYSLCPIGMAWEAFEEKNGTRDFREFSARLLKYRERNRIETTYPSVGCIILTAPFFFDRKDWILPPENWPTSAVVGKGLDASGAEGRRLLRDIEDRLAGGAGAPLPLTDERLAGGAGGPFPLTDERLTGAAITPLPFTEEKPRYGEGTVKLRLGQGAFRVSVADAYERRCAVSGEKTLPVLQAAHIRPYSSDGPHEIPNGILLRSDIHTLFDDGYITIAPDHHIEVSRRLREDFGNGKIYYLYHGQKLAQLPASPADLPSKSYLEWHNERVYLG